MDLNLKEENTLDKGKSSRRRTLRLRGYDYSQPGAYFITICTSGRKCFFGDIVGNEVRLSHCGLLIAKEWSRISDTWTAVQVDTFILMPNHLHGILVIEESDGASRPTTTCTTPAGSPLRNGIQPHSIGAIVAQFKSRVTKSLLKEGLSAFGWQRNYYEHIVRNEKELEQIREYIVNNPAKWEEDTENPTATSWASRPPAKHTTTAGSPLRNVQTTP